MSASKLVSRAAVRAASTPTITSNMTKAAGDISSVFPSLRPDYKPEPLPPRFKELKQKLFEKNEKALVQSWKRLLESLEKEVHEIKVKGSDVRHPAMHCDLFSLDADGQQVIPSVQYADIVSGRVSDRALAEILHRGSVVIRNVIPRKEARGWKNRVEEYVAANKERVKAFPPDSPAVFELYWTPSQAEARAHPNMLETQRFLQRLWHSSDPATRISTRYPLTYADRLRISSREMVNSRLVPMWMGVHSSVGRIPSIRGSTPRSWRANGKNTTLGMRSTEFPLRWICTMEREHALC